MSEEQVDVAPPGTIPLPLTAISSPDPQGRYTANVDFPNQPVKIDVGLPNFKRDYAVQLPLNTEVLRVSNFIGVDRGDVVEADFEVWTAKGSRLIQRSEHKEGVVIFDSWKTYSPDFQTSEGDRWIVFTLVGHPTGKNVITGDAWAKIHWGVRLTLRSVPGPITIIGTNDAA